MRRLIGVTGPPGAGKSTYADALVAAAEEPAVVVPMDGFHLADRVLESLGLLDRKGAPETFDVDGYAALLARLREEGERPVYAPGFERTLEQPVAAALVVPPVARLVVTEGNYLLDPDPRWRAARARLDAVWWVDVDEQQRHTQLVARHERFGKTPDEARAWVARVDDANAARIQDRADDPDRTVRATDDGGWALA